MTAVLNSHRARRWTLIVYWVAMFTSTHWPDIGRYAPETGWPFAHFDKLVHVSLYAGWVFFWWRCLAGRGWTVSRSAWTWLLVGGALWALADELSQAVVARTPSWGDWLCDVAGLAVAFMVLSLWQVHRVDGRPA